jgi:hypothetical protein
MLFTNDPLLTIQKSRFNLFNEIGVNKLHSFRVGSDQSFVFIHAMFTNVQCQEIFQSLLILSSDPDIIYIEASNINAIRTFFQ